MPIIDIIIAVAILASVIMGIVRGFVKEAISVAALVVAIWAALYFGPGVGKISESWLGSPGLQMLFGRILVFLVILALGGLLGWGIGKIVRMSALSGFDRALGSAFGAVRGVLLVAVAVLAGQAGGFDQDEWWLNSRLIPHLEVVADWIRVMAPRGIEALTPDGEVEPIPVEVLFDR